MTEGCGIANEKQRIVGGLEVPAHSYPWMVGLSFNSQWFCGGTLLNKGSFQLISCYPNTVLLSNPFHILRVGPHRCSLHPPVSPPCLAQSGLISPARAISSYVYLGAHNLYDTEAGRKIIYTTEFVAHPNYDMESIANDVSLVRLPSGSVTEYTGERFSSPGPELSLTLQTTSSPPVSRPGDTRSPS